MIYIWKRNSGNEKAVHENCKFTLGVLLEALFNGCKVKYPNSGNNIMKVIGVPSSADELHSSAFVLKPS